MLSTYRLIAARRNLYIRLGDAEKVRAAVYIALSLVQCVPDICSILQAILRLKGGIKAGEVYGQVTSFVDFNVIFYQIVILETCRTIGLSILMFQVLPQLDVQRGLYLLFCLPIIAVVQRFLAAMANASRNASSFSTRISMTAMLQSHFCI